MPLLFCSLAILALILLVVWCKLDTFLSFMVVSIGLGLACGMDAHRISMAMQTGIGKILGSLVIILGLGAMLGKLVADSGAAQRIMEGLTKMVGVKGLPWGMALAGLLIGIPLFYNAGFVVVMPLIIAVGASTRLPLLYVGVPMLAALSVAHGFLPPHPSPTVISQQLHADLGKTLCYGLVAAVPAIIVAGPLFARTLKKYRPVPDPALLSVKVMEKAQLPGLGVSLLAALMPLLLLTVTTVFHNKFIEFIGEPNIAMLISVLFAVYVLGLRRGQKMTAVMSSLEGAFKGVAPILLIIAGSGIFVEVLQEGGVVQYIADQLKGSPLPPLILGWSIAAVIRVSVGSATVAGITAAGIMQPLLAGARPELMVLAIGAGSLMFSHVNDGGFWLFKQYFNLSMGQTFKTWSIMETIVSVTGLLAVLAMNQFL
jgi:Gnt-I system high-affinity gluconate transporter